MKQMKFNGLMIATVLVMAALSSCTVLTKSMREPNVRVALEINDFTLSDRVTGQATQTLVFGIDWTRLFKRETGSISVPIVSTNVRTNLAERYAIYNLLSKNPDYDVLFYPTFSSETKRILGIYEQTQVTVNARLGKFIVK
jgi:hypothetical protein